VIDAVVRRHLALERLQGLAAGSGGASRSQL
jgi:hypothetical protein